MTIYEYWCRTCNRKFEMLVLKDSDGKETVCPACGRRDLDRKLTFLAPKDSRSVSSPSRFGPEKDPA